MCGPEARFDGHPSAEPEKRAIERSLRALVASELQQVLEPADIDVLVLGNDFGQLDAVTQVLRASLVFDVRTTMAFSIETVREAARLHTFDVVIATGSCGRDVFAQIPSLPIDSATLYIADQPTAGVVAHALTTGAMAVLDVNEVATGLLERTLQQILLRREAQNVLVKRLMESVAEDYETEAEPAQPLLPFPLPGKERARDAAGLTPAA